MEVRIHESTVTHDDAVLLMSDSPETTGYDLCRTCLGYETCTFRNGSHGPVMHCAEFKPFPSRPVLATASVPAAEPEPAAEPQPEYSGLCRNCDNRADCVYVDADRVILHCEEYR